MKSGNANLTQRTGYPQQRSSANGNRSTFLDLPTGEETEGAALYTSPPGKVHPAPQRRSWRNREEPWPVRLLSAASEASFYTRASYVWTFVSLLVAWWGFRNIRYGHASVWLTCHSSSCDLEITPPGRTKTQSIHILRSQLVRADVVKVDTDGNVMEVVDSVGSAGAGAETLALPNRGKKGKGGKYKGHGNEYTGPDENGWYDSYAIVLKEEGGGGGEGGLGGNSGPTDAKRQDDRLVLGKEDEEKKRKLINEWDDDVPSKNSLFALTDFVMPNARGEYVFSMRRYNTGQSRRKALTTVTRINSYVRNRRHKLAVRESRNASWQGILGIVLGLFSFMLSLLIGQFWEPEERHKMSGPGVRRNPGPNAPGRRAPPASAGLYGRPGGGGGTVRKKTTAVSGYGSYGGYRPSAPQKRAY